MYVCVCVCAVNKEELTLSDHETEVIESPSSIKSHSLDTYGAQVTQSSYTTHTHTHTYTRTHTLTHTHTPDMYMHSRGRRQYLAPPPASSVMTSLGD